MTQANDTERELNWDDAISDTGQGAQYTLLPPGYYPFTVLGLERKRHVPRAGGKLPGCPKAVLKVQIDGGTLGSTTITHNLFLHSRCEGLLYDFFKSIGECKPGEELPSMNWNQVPGATGRCQVKQVPGYEDPSKLFNEISRFCDTAVAAPPANTGFTPGEF